MPWTDVPSGWPTPPQAVLSRAATAASSALTRPGSPTVADQLLTAHAPEAGHPAALLEWVPPRGMDSVGAADLLTVATLGHTLSPRQVRRILGATPEVAAVHRRLRSLPATDLYLAGPEELSGMEQLHIDIAIALSDPAQPAAQRNAAATALCARLRPGLFPLDGSQLRRAMELPLDGDHRTTWVTMRHVLQNGDVNVALHTLEDQVRSAHPRVDLGHSPLRLLEAALIPMTQA